jgi:hypothetical protein
MNLEFLSTNANSMNVKIHKLIIKSILSNKAKFRFVIELDIIITCNEILKL